MSNTRTAKMWQRAAALDAHYGRLTTNLLLKVFYQIESARRYKLARQAMGMDF